MHILTYILIYIIHLHGSLSAHTSMKHPASTWKILRKKFQKAQRCVCVCVCLLMFVCISLSTDTETEEDSSNIFWRSNVHMRKNGDRYQIFYYISTRLRIFSYSRKFNPPRVQAGGRGELLRADGSY